MKRVLVVALFALGCGGVSPRPTSSTPPPVEAPAVATTRATLTTTLYLDHVEWTLVVGTERLCFDDSTCVEAGETRRSAEIYAPVVPLEDGVVVPARSLIRYSHADVDPEIRSERVHLARLGGGTVVAITRAPIEMAGGVGVRIPSGAQLDGRGLIEQVREEVQRVREALGEPVQPLLLTVGEVAELSLEGEGLVVVAPTDTATDLRTKLISAWVGASPEWSGIAHYVAWRIEGLDTDDLLSQWLVAYAEYRARAGVAPNSGHTRVSSGGIVAALCTDVELHEAGTSLTATVSRAATDLSTLPTPIANRLRNRLTFTGVIDVAPCLAPLGRELVAVRYADVAASRLLRVGVDDSLRVTSARGFFRRGDVLESVGGLDLRSPSDIAWALHDTDVGDRFIVVLRRGEQTLRTWARRPRTDDAPTRVRFTLRETEGRPEVDLD